jgi:lipoyl-dependent peroxiredoxin
VAVRSGAMSAELTNVVYACKVTVHGGRAGHAQSADGKLNVDLSPHADKAGTGTNPEQLFAAAYGACFHSALMAEAKGAGVDLTDSTIVAHVSLGPTKQGGFGLAVTLDLEAPALDAHKAHELLHAAHQRCPYSSAIRGNVRVKFLLGGQPLPPAG